MRKNTPSTYQNFAELLYTQALSKTLLTKPDVVNSCHTEF